MAVVGPPSIAADTAESGVAGRARTVSSVVRDSLRLRRFAGTPVAEVAGGS
jgi:hypothetical protein